MCKLSLTDRSVDRMNNYFLSVNNKGRVILDLKSHGDVIREISALNYKEAREDVDTTYMLKVDGHGWFLR